MERDLSLSLIFFFLFYFFWLCELEFGFIKMNTVHINILQAIQNGLFSGLVPLLFTTPSVFAMLQVIGLYIVFYIYSL